MKEHCDHIHSMFDGTRKGIPSLSILGSLNNDYEGGELVFWQDQKIELKAGSIMIFPSNFLYPHKVVEVTKGVRYSYVSWVW
jgi:predicted 2-oxoglutarate/Fe(II)-dependent dioxygenase YbiX